MKKNILLFFFIALNLICFSQPLRIAILDFDNISGIAKYDGLGKAMSSMLISDIESNVSSKRLQLVERAQINKIMKEQNLQKTTSFDKSTSVKMGKLLGVNYLLIGDIYILDNSLVINARLTNASTGDIKFSEKQEGKINEWLTVKTKLGKGVVTSISMPFTEPRIPDGVISPAILTTYASAIVEKDNGNFDKAETLINTAKDFDPGFKYLDDIKDEIDNLKKQIAELQKEVEVIVDDPIDASEKFIEQKDFANAIKYLEIGCKKIDDFNYGEKYVYFHHFAKVYSQNNQFNQAIQYADSLLEINNYEPEAIIIKSRSLSAIGKKKEALLIIENLLQTDFYKRNNETYYQNFYKFYLVNNNKYLTGLRFIQSAGAYKFEKQFPRHESNFIDFRKSMYTRFGSTPIYFFSSHDREYYQMPLRVLDLIVEYARIMEEFNYPPDSISYKIYKLNIKSSAENKEFSNHTCENLHCDRHIYCEKGFFNGIHLFFI